MKMENVIYLERVIIIMDRRSFLQFMGVSSASIVASKALAKLPEAESQIILLDKPKDIIMAKNMPDVDFVIEQLVAIDYNRKENLQENYSLSGGQYLSPGHIGVSIELETYVEFKNFNFIEQRQTPAIFTFDLHFEDIYAKTYKQHEALNGRKFMIDSYEVKANVGSFTMCNISAIEIMR